MKRNQLLALFLAAALCFAMMIPTFAGDDIAEPAQTVLSPELQELENAANEKYEKLLSAWACASDSADSTDTVFPAFYGGVYVDDNKNLVIQVTSLNDDIVAYFGGIIDLSNVVFEEVTYSFNELKAVHSSIVEKARAHCNDDIISDISGVGISFPDNAVNLYIVTSETTARSRSFLNEIRENVSDFDHINIIATSGKYTPCASVEPGSETYNFDYSAGMTYYRSVGFWAYNKDGELGIVTAPHDNMAAGNLVKVDDKIFGVAETPYYSGNVDAVFVKRTNTEFFPSRYVAGWNFMLTAGSYAGVVVGTTIYAKGIASGCITGKTLDVNYTMPYSPFLTDCVLTDAIAQNGDSGGVVAGLGNSNYRPLVGIMSGITGGNMIYVTASNILAALGTGATVY